MPYPGSGALRSRRRDDGLSVLEDASCGHCARCLAGCSLWCSGPVWRGRTLGSPFTPTAAAALGQALLTVAGLREVGRPGVVVTTGPHARVAAVLAEAVTGSPVLWAADTRDVGLRADLERREPTGRAAVVVTTSAVRDAVRAVRRGGAVVVTGTAPVLPSTTELVQREVSLVTPLDIAHLHDVLEPARWEAAVAAA